MDGNRIYIAIDLKIILCVCEMQGAGAFLYHCAAPDGVLSGIQHQDLSDLSEIYRAGGYPCVFH